MGESAGEQRQRADAVRGQAQTGFDPAVDAGSGGISGRASWLPHSPLDGRHSNSTVSTIAEPQHKHFQGARLRCGRSLPDNRRMIQTAADALAAVISRASRASTARASCLASVR